MILYKSTAYEFNYDVRYNKITLKLEETPQVRHYVLLPDTLQIDIQFLKFSPKAIVRRTSQDKSILSFVF